MTDFNYSKEAIDLFYRQKSNWNTIIANYDSLARARVRSLRVGKSTILLQHNPDRLRSTAAKVDEPSLKARPCFLCSEHQPQEQETVVWNQKYKIQVNPYPIFSCHFTIASLEHTPQCIAGRMPHMLQLAHDLPQCVVFYNGPKCGASAPHHMHFQAGHKGEMPYCREVDESTLSMIECDSDGFLALSQGLACLSFYIKASSLAHASQLFDRLQVAMPVPTGHNEPMHNILCWFNGTDVHPQYCIAVFPRRKHRPRNYGSEEGQFMLSPASVDMGGLWAVPVQRDFETLTATHVQEIFDEVCMTAVEANDMIKKLKKNKNYNMINQVPLVRVGIMNEPQVEFVLNSDYRVLGTVAQGSQQVHCTAGKIVWNGASYDELLFEPVDTNNSSFTLKDVTIGVSFHWRRKENQSFKGALHLIVENDKITPINVLSVEDYLLSVISSEMSAQASLELLKAHAVISRSWLLAQINKDKQGGDSQAAHVMLGDSAQQPDEDIKWWDRDDHVNFDVCADDHCQRYQGITRASTATVEQAVKATWGQVLMYDGVLCDARFSKSCGGVLEEFENCWQPQHYDYLVARRDGENEMDFADLTQEEEATKWILSSPEAFCNTNSPEILSQVLNDYDQETKDFYRWQVEYTQAELADLIYRRTGVDYGRIKDLQPVARGTSGRLYKLKIVGEKLSRTIGKELAIRYALSESCLYSSAFVVEKLDVDAQGYPQRFVLRGAGWGHGVGLCQIGAAVMGTKGYDYKSILLHYFINASINELY
jgi:hypothetical protein